MISIEAKERMDGLVDGKLLSEARAAIRKIVIELTEDGFDASDVKDYLREALYLKINKKAS